MAKVSLPRIAVIGAGPIGLEAALYARQLGYPTIVFEKGDIGEHLTRWGHIRMFTPFGMNSSPLGINLIRREHPGHPLPNEGDFHTGGELRDAYLTPLAMSSYLSECILSKTEVVSIGRRGMDRLTPADFPKRASSLFRILVRNEKGAERFEEANIILDCTGTYSHHRWAGDGGIPAIGERSSEKLIPYGLEPVLGAKKNQYAGRSIIVIGSGFSAASTVCDLATLAEENSATWVIWLARSSRTTPLPRNPSDPLRERDRLAAKANSLATRGDRNVEYHGSTRIDSIESHGQDKGFRITARCGSEEMTWEVDRVIANVGYRASWDIATELHVSENIGSVVQAEPNYFVLGAKSYSRDPGFLLRLGLEQIRDVFARISGKASLDLYRETGLTIRRAA